VTGPEPMPERLKKRRDFLAAAKGQRAARRAFVLEARLREDEGGPRFGFTVSKRTAVKAVERNRIRRRLREAVKRAAPENARPGHDYVLIGRRGALTEPFADLTSALADAMRRISDMADPTGASGARRPGR
jgi:ribonuclease P protein component